MKKNLISFILVFFISLEGFAQMETVTILHISDTHSNLAPLAPRTSNLKGTRGGIARAATVVGQTKLTEPNVLFFHTGDLFVGDFFFNKYFGAAEFQLLNELGLDAMALGNHEFDLAPSTLIGSLQNSFMPTEGFPLLSCNTLIDDPALSELQNYVKPYFIKEFDTLKVGVFGLLTPETNILSLPEPAFIDTNIFSHAVSAIEQLTEDNCNLIICLSHLGLSLDKVVAENLPGIDIILGGHDHYSMEAPVEITNPAGKTTYIIHSGAFYESVGKLKVQFNSGEFEGVDYKLIALDENIPEEPTISLQVDTMIEGIESQFGPVFTEEIGSASSFFSEVPENLFGIGPHDTHVGNLVTDAFRSKTGTEIAIEPGGSTAQPIYDGPIVGADIFRTLGYGFNTVNAHGFRIVTFDLTGAQIWGGIEFGLANIEENDEFFIQASGLTYDFSPNKPPFSRLNYVLIDEVPIEQDSLYSITTNEFVLAALDELLGLVPQNIVLYDSLSEYQVVSEYIKGLGTIHPQHGRITEVNVNTLNTPEDFELMQNYPNPFNPSTTINFYAPGAGYVEVSIFNVLGELITTLLSQNIDEGKHKVVWNAAGFPSGVYFYSLTLNDKVKSKKMILLK